MNDDGLQASAPEDFVEAQKTIDLPIEQGGKKLRVTIRALEPLTLLEEFGRIPQLMAGDTSAQAQRDVAKMLADLSEQASIFRRVAKLGVVAPRLCFDGEPGPHEVPWGRIHYENRTFISLAILELSGLIREAAAAWITFRAVLGGGDGGGDAAAQDGRADGDQAASAAGAAPGDARGADLRVGT